VLLLIVGETQLELDGIRVNQIWILKDSGSCLFSMSFAKDKENLLDQTVFTALFTSIFEFVYELTETPIKKIATANMALHVSKKDNLLICLSADEEIKNEVLLSKILSNLMEEFESDYKALIASDSQFDVSEFESKLLEILNVKFYSKKTPSFTMFFILLDKIIENVVTSVISGDRIAVIGDETQIEVIITSLELFCPHRDLKKVYWTNKEMEKADIIGIPRKLEQSYANQGYKILDAENLGKFKGTPNKFVNKLLKDIKNVKDPLKVMYIIQTRIDYFISRVNTIMNLYKRIEVDNEAEVFLRTDIDHFDLFDLIIKYIRNIIDPEFELPKQKSVWRKLDDF